MSEHPNGELAAELERDLRRVLAPERPDPEAFRKRVAEKIAQRKALFDPSLRARILRRAAGFLPPDLASSALAGGAVSLTLKSVLSKTVLWTLALPATLLAMTAASFVMGVRTVRGGLAGDLVGDPATLRELAKQEIGGWWRRNWVFAVLLGATVFYAREYAPTWAPNVLLAGLLLTTLGVVLLVRLLADVGLASRPIVGRLATQVLVCWGIFPLQLFAGRWGWPHSGAEQVTRNQLGVVIGVGFCCNWLSIDDERARWRWGRWLALFGIALWLGSVVGQWNRQGATRGELAAYVEEWGPEQPGAWRQLAVTATWLEECGYRRLDLEAASREARRAVDRGSRIPDELVGAAAQLDLLDADRWDVVFAASRYPHGFVLESVVGVDPRDRLRVGTDSSVADWIRATLRARELSDMDRDRIAAAIVQDWPAVTEPYALERVLAICDALDALGRASGLADKASEVRALLAARWLYLGEEGRYRAGFSHGGESEPRVDDDATRAGIELMIRFGVPPEIDLRALRGSLRRETRRFSVWEPVNWNDVEDCVALDRLVTKLPGARRTPLETLFAYRLHMALALLTALCFYATLRAPKQTEVASRRPPPLPDVPAPSAGE